MLPACTSGHIVSEVFDFAAICPSKRGSEYKERCSAINVEGDLGTTILSVVVVEHLSDVNRIVCYAVQQTIEFL